MGIKRKAKRFFGLCVTIGKRYTCGAKIFSGIMAVTPPE